MSSSHYTKMSRNTSKSGARKLRAANRALKLKRIAIMLFGLTLCYLLVHHRGVVLFFLLIVMPW